MKRFSGLAATILSLALAATAHAQNDSLLFEDNTRIDTTARGELRVDIDAMAFFRDNEYKGRLTKGYTLPGFRLQPTLTFQPLRNLKLEAGLYMLHYWGANKYPNMNYKDIATWKGEQTQKGLHVLPFFNAQLAVSPNVDIIIGNIYGRANHRLAEPLYNPEAFLSADPEAGLQILWHNRFLDFDTWINWESFIFNNDNHQEAFTYGLSTRLKANAPSHTVHVYFPIQLLMQHRGGEINPDAESRQVKTWANAAAGAGLTLATSNHVVTRINLEAEAMYYKQVAGSMLPFKQGYGAYAKADFQLWHDFNLRTAYWRGHNFITIFGNPLYGSMGIYQEGYTMTNTQTINARFSYSHNLGHGFAWGAYADAFDNLPANAFSTENGKYREKNSLSVSAGIYLRINPSYLIKRL